MPRQSIDLTTSISGIPCSIHIDTFIVVKPWKGSPQTCPSADDFYGYTDIEFTILDRNGYNAPWLSNKLTQSDQDRIESEILTYREIHS